MGLMSRVGISQVDTARQEQWLRVLGFSLSHSRVVSRTLGLVHSTRPSTTRAKGCPLKASHRYRSRARCLSLSLTHLPFCQTSARKVENSMGCVAENKPTICAPPLLLALRLLLCCNKSRMKRSNFLHASAQPSLAQFHAHPGRTVNGHEQRPCGSPPLARRQQWRQRHWRMDLARCWHRWRTLSALVAPARAMSAASFALRISASPMPAL